MVNSPRPVRRVFVLGLDGATYDLIRPWVDEGHLPNFQCLLRDGASGDLETVIPPYTPVAWPSFMTGMNPAKHGIFDFMYRDDKDGRFNVSFYNRSHIRAEPFWHILNSHGRHTGVINVPMTFPPEPVDGFMISGLGTPSQEATYTYPSSLADRLGNYLVVERNLYTKDLDSLLEELHYMVEERRQALLQLMDEEAWDCLTCVFTATDTVQHQFWKFIDPHHPQYTTKGAERFGDAIFTIYVKMDAILGEILARLGERDILLVMSDHGFGPLYNFIHANNVLITLGLLRFKRTPLALAKTLLYRAGITALNVYRVMHSLNLGSANDRRQRQKVRNLMQLIFLSFDDVDWSRTIAYSLGNFGQLYLNMRGREPQGIVGQDEYYQTRKSIRHQLASFVNPETGRPLFGRIFAKEELYEGPCLDQAPDILYFPAEEADMVFGKYEFGSNRVVELGFATSAQHKMNGVFAAYGHGVRPGVELEGASIIDIAPTVLYLLGVPIPCEMDGRVLKDVLSSDLMRDFPITFGEDRRYVQDRSGYSDEDEDRIREHLKRLGYVA